MVSFAALIAYSFEVTGCQPFILTGKIVEGLPPLQVPPFSLSTANGTVSFTEMVQVSRDGARPAWLSRRGPWAWFWPVPPARWPGAHRTKGCLWVQGRQEGTPDGARPRAPH